MRFVHGSWIISPDDFCSQCISAQVMGAFRFQEGL
jgi:hypothetical protein